VRNFAKKISQTLEIPISHNLTKTKATKEQKIFESVVSKKENVKDAFDYQPATEIEGKKIIIFDDIFDSGATIKETGNLLTKLGAEMIVPLTIAKTVGGDLV
jgi:ATP-dependent DNA helicase RecQ